MAWVFMTDPTTGNVGLYDEPVASGAYDDPDSARNAPLNDPDGNLAYVYWHILFDNMAVFIDTTVSITHAAVSAGGSGSGGINSTSGFDYAGPIVDWTLATHNLGYEPIAYAAVGNNFITPGYIVQVASGLTGGARYVTVWSDTTKTYLREYASRGAAILPSITLSYDVLVIKRQPAAEGNIPPQLLDYDPITGLTKMGDGRWRSDEKYLQVVPGGSPYELALEATMDADNGAVRFVRPDGTTFDPVPSTLATGYSTSRFSMVAGSPINYQGSFTGSGTVILVQAP
jgi:hypothetical protein